MNLYSVFKSFERAYATVPRRIQLMNGRALPPLQVVLELTYRCNLTCTFCYLRRQQHELGVEYSRNELTFNDIKAIIDQTLPWTLIVLSGGEMFLRKDILDILDYTAKKRRCHIITNGTCITPEIAQHLIELGLTSIGVSIEGPEDIHDRIRGRHSFAKATAAMKMLVDQKRGKKFPLINLKTTITSDNLEHLTESIDLAERLGADFCTFQVMNTSLLIGGISLHDELDCYQVPPPPIVDFPIDTLERQLQRVKERAAQSSVMVRVVPDMTIEQMLDHYASMEDVRGYSCVTPWTGLNVSATGEVFPCFNYRMGNLREQPLMKIWNNEKYRGFRRSLLTDGLFPGCAGCCDLVPLSGVEHRSPQRA